jgi:hypothetical protein
MVAAVAFVVRWREDAYLNPIATFIGWLVLKTYQMGWRRSELSLWPLGFISFTASKYAAREAGRTSHGI